MKINFVVLGSQWFVSKPLWNIKDSTIKKAVYVNICCNKSNLKEFSEIQVNIFISKNQNVQSYYCLSLYTAFQRFLKCEEVLEVGSED